MQVDESERGEVFSTVIYVRCKLYSSTYSIFLKAVFLGCIEKRWNVLNWKLECQILHHVMKPLHNLAGCQLFAISEMPTLTESLHEI